MPNDNKIGAEINQIRKILQEVKEIKRILNENTTNSQHK